MIRCVRSSEDQYVRRQQKIGKDQEEARKKIKPNKRNRKIREKQKDKSPKDRDKPENMESHLSIDLKIQMNLY